MKKLLPAAVTLLMISLSFLFSAVRAAPQKELNLLCWVSYEERAMLEPFEKKYNVKVKYKTFVSDDQMYALMASSKNQYDVVTLGPEYVEKLHKIGRLAPLNPADYNFKDYIKPFQKFPMCWPDGKLYAVIDGYGANALLYNTNHITAKDVETYDILWSPKVKGKVGIWDWYLPTMGTLSSAIGNNANPTNLSNRKFQVLEKRLMDLRPQVAAVFGSPSELTSAVANDQVWIVPGCGEWIAAIVKEQGKPVDWAVPKTGGQMWIEALAMPNDAPHPDVAKLYIQWMQTPEAQKLKSERKAYNCNVPNIRAYDLMSKAHKDALKIHNESEAVALVNKLAIRRLPAQQPETQWQDAWQKFKAAR
jgi:spermidine/putrescine transport system substrate-binding protein